MPVTKFKNSQKPNYVLFINLCIKSFFRNAFKETLCGRPRLNSVYTGRTEIQIPNNGANIQNGLNGSGRQRLQGVISSASEVKASETVVLLNGQDIDMDRTKSMDVFSLTVTSLTNNAVSDQVEDCLNGKRYIFN